MVGLLRRTLVPMDKPMFVTLFKTLVRPKLEYNNSVWHPNSKVDMKQLEAVQRRATKMLPGMKNLSYPERLKALNLPTIQYRRMRGDLIQVYKYLNNYYNVQWSKLFHVKHDPVYHTRGHRFKLSKNSFQSKIRQNFFSVRVINNWNSLPEEIVCATSLNEFKNAVDKHWNDYSVKYDPEGTLLPVTGY